MTPKRNDQKTRVLFVDDEPNVLAGLRRMLRSRRREWEMDFAEGGAIALELMAADPFDVVVSDMRMPGMDGAELLSRIRDGWPGAVRLVLSGQSDRELTLRAVGPAHQYLSKPCDAQLLYDTISKTCAVRRELNNPEVSRLVGQIAWLPSLPEAYVNLVTEMNSDDASIDAAGQIIAQDVGMSAKILQLINSSFFGLPVHVETVEHATALLGLNVLRPLVLSSKVFQQFEQGDLGGFPLPAMVDHSLCVAMLARRIATLEQAPIEVVDNALLAGLMHDVGQIVLAMNLPGDYRTARELAAAGDRPLDEIEAEVFGATHTEVGGYLLSLWGLPADLLEAVTLHHHPERASGDRFSPLTAVHAAEALVAADNESVPEDAAFSTAYFERLGLVERAEVWRQCWETPLAEAK